MRREIKKKAHFLAAVLWDGSLTLLKGLFFLAGVVWFGSAPFTPFLAALVLSDPTGVTKTEAMFGIACLSHAVVAVGGLSLLSYYDAKGRHRIEAIRKRLDTEYAPTSPEPGDLEGVDE